MEKLGVIANGQNLYLLSLESIFLPSLPPPPLLIPHVGQEIITPFRALARTRAIAVMLISLLSTTALIR